MSSSRSESTPEGVLTQYSLAVEMADRVSARRGTANAFYLTVQTILVSAVGLGALSNNAVPPAPIVVVCVAGIVVSAGWWLQLRSYRDLNTAKFTVINRLEEVLPVTPFTDEWAILKKEHTTWRDRYSELGATERIVPWIFALLFLSLIFVKAQQ